MRPIVESLNGVTLIGGGPVGRRELMQALRRAPDVVAVDGGADAALAAGLNPLAVIGDFDSISDAARAAIDPARLHPIPEQATTDFDKALRSVTAPFVLGVGFQGARLDHGLAALNTMLRRPDRTCLLLGPADVIFHAPPRLRLTLAPGDRLSLFPMRSVTGQSRGLHWPIDGLDFAPDGMIGTSNRVCESAVELMFDGPGMIVILPRARLDSALRALVPGWRAPRAARVG
ncbi:thiamine diphosphokinase [Neotabrizicola shimadae]|nr:thiamine diphosphokinase [Neotabrizicola shimadae]